MTISSAPRSQLELLIELEPEAGRLLPGFRGAHRGVGQFTHPFMIHQSPGNADSGTLTL